jgi:hypothetical protein
MSNLFLLTGTDPDDSESDRTLLVSAHDAAEAFQFWKTYYWQEDTDEFATYDGEILENDPGGETLQIWMVKHDPFHAGPLEWDGTQCRCVGYVKPSEV